MAIVKVERGKTAQDRREDYIRAMYLLYLRCPGGDTKDETGAYHLGNISNPAPKTWSKATPYSVARKALDE